MFVRTTLLSAALWCVLAPATVLAQDAPALAELKRLQAALDILNQELKSGFEEMQTLQRAIDANRLMPPETQRRSPDIVTVDEVAEKQRRTLQQEAALDAQLNALLQRIQALNARKQPIVERVLELSAPDLAAPAAPSAPATPTTTMGSISPASPSSAVTPGSPTTSPGSPGTTPATPSAAPTMAPRGAPPPSSR